MRESNEPFFFFQLLSTTTWNKRETSRSSVQCIVVVVVVGCGGSRVELRQSRAGVVDFALYGPG